MDEAAAMLAEDPEIARTVVTPPVSHRRRRRGLRCGIGQDHSNAIRIVIEPS